MKLSCKADYISSSKFLEFYLAIHLLLYKSFLMDELTSSSLRGVYPEFIEGLSTCSTGRIGAAVVRLISTSYLKRTNNPMIVYRPINAFGVFNSVC
jgi:hypothetical protein